ncbi:hypothetical protein chiPu_0020183 [Chiloscyllium punctatum]|uniref:HIT-type domain-containing protein n=1 Tax=Chiloscyllium punctatum TaxID=137246 RepID=A0A401RU82_CHIPU|nr:hypothetical protein [Chiloscyllium punctatum]
MQLTDRHPVENLPEKPKASQCSVYRGMPLIQRSRYGRRMAKKKKKTRGDHFKQRFRKNFQSLLEEQNLSTSEGPNYLTTCAGPSKLPQRHFCAVCGFPSNYTCVSCGARYCCVKCLGTHQETRCLKWTV